MLLTVVHGIVKLIWKEEALLPGSFCCVGQGALYFHNVSLHLTCVYENRGFVRTS